MEKPGAGIATSNLDTRLLRFRSRPGSEDVGALAQALLDEGRAAEAIEVASTGLRQRPDDPQLLLLEGQAWFREGDLIRAQASLLKSAKGGPSAPQAFRWLGEVLLKRGDPERALKVLDRAAAMGARDPEVERLRARAIRYSKIGGDGSPSSLPPPVPSAPRPGRFEPEVPVETGARRVPPEQARPRPSIPARPEPARPAPVRSAPVRSAPPRPGVGTLPLRSAPLPSAPEASAAAEPPPPPATLQGLGSLDAPPTGLPDLFPDVSGAPAASPLEPAVLDVGPPLDSKSSVPPPLPPAPSGIDAFFDPSEATVPHRRSPREAPATPPVDVAMPSPSEASRFDPGQAMPRGQAGALGASVGTSENVDRVLSMLEREGIFESPQGAVAAWTPAKEAKGVRLSVGKGLAVLWGVAVLLAVGGYFAWEWWVDQRHRDADALVATARAEAMHGDNAKLYDAERHLVQARELYPLGLEALEVLLFVHCQRALEDGSFSPGYLRPTIAQVRARIEELSADANLVPAGVALEQAVPRLEAYNALAVAVVSAAEGQQEEATEAIAEALAKAPNDGPVGYVVGRLEQRLGVDGALARLEAAFAADSSLSAAGIALAEARADAGQPEEALALLESVFEAHPGHLRATLWRGFLSADDVDPPDGLATLDSLTERLSEHGAATDQVLAHLSRARLLRRAGEAEAARESVENATRAGATEPRLLALVAAEALAVGELADAQRAATAAVRGAPHNHYFRKLLSSVVLARRDGVRALQTLGQLSMDDPEVLSMSAQAALIVGAPEALQAASDAVDRFLDGQEDPSVEIQALRVRLRAAVGQGRDALREARALARSSPGDPFAALALGESALAVGEGQIASQALTRLTAASPDNADGHFLLGRAQRMLAKAEEAEAALRRAIELSPGHTEARLALGRLLLDRGRYADAESLYRELARQSSVASGSSTALLGRLGRVEALLGQGRVDDANVQLEALSEADRNTGLAKLTSALVALASDRAGDAVSALGSLAQAEGASSDVLSLYADALLRSGEVEAALANYERALEIDSGLPEALLGRAELAVRAEISREARTYLERAERSLARRIRPPRLHGRLHLLTGRSYLNDGARGREDARRSLRRAVEFDRVPEEAWFYLGEALAGENAPEARQAYQRYLEVAPEGPYSGRARRAID